MMRNIPWVRLLLAGMFLAATCWNAAKAVDGNLQFALAFASVICLLVASILLGSTLIRQAAWPFTGLIDSIYSGRDQQDENPRSTI